MVGLGLDIPDRHRSDLRCMMREGRCIAVSTLLKYSPTDRAVRGIPAEVCELLDITRKSAAPSQICQALVPPHTLFILFNAMSSVFACGGEEPL